MPRRRHRAAYCPVTERAVREEEAGRQHAQKLAPSAFSPRDSDSLSSSNPLMRKMVALLSPFVSTRLTWRAAAATTTTTTMCNQNVWMCAYVGRAQRVSPNVLLCENLPLVPFYTHRLACPAGEVSQFRNLQVSDATIWCVAVRVLAHKQTQTSYRCFAEFAYPCQLRAQPRRVPGGHAIQNFPQPSEFCHRAEFTPQPSTEPG